MSSPVPTSLITTAKRPWIAPTVRCAVLRDITRNSPVFRMDYDSSHFDAYVAS